MQSQLFDIDVRLKCIASCEMAATLPRLLQPEEFIYSLNDLGKKLYTAPDIFRSRLSDILSAFAGY